ncbi:MAG: hypothetical protein KJ950_13360 [Proteobacteria bacterium]|nr:hypothetical protein [Pseudomonadota bacterium]MBU1687430.1 hypothetical protein [Pseudomonadota bacterium]
MTDKRKLHEKKLEAQWREWNAQIARFKTKTEKAKAEVKVNDTPPEDLPND